MGQPNVVTAVKTFRWAFGYMTVMTLVWLFLNLTGGDGGLFFRDYRVSGPVIGRILAGFLVFWVGWSWMFYRLKRAGLGEKEPELAFSNRGRRGSVRSGGESGVPPRGWSLGHREGNGPPGRPLPLRGHPI